MKILSVVTLLAIICLSSARKIIIKSNPDRNADLFQEKDLTFTQDKDDNVEPTIFRGDPMKTKTLISENVQGKKNFKFALGTQNGIEIEQVGRLKDDNKTLVVKGSYSYTGADGKRYRVRYTADELGYHPITELELDIPDANANGGNPNRPSSSFGLSNGPRASPVLAPRATQPRATQPPTTKNPFSQSNFLNKRYLPPSNSYLPPSGNDLPPSSDFTGDLLAPLNSV